MSENDENNGSSSSCSNALEWELIPKEEEREEERERERGSGRSNKRGLVLQSNYFAILPSHHEEVLQEDTWNWETVGCASFSWAPPPPPLRNPSPDWMEPLQPYRSCILASTEEEEESLPSQRSGSDKSVAVQEEGELKTLLVDSFVYVTGWISVSSSCSLDDIEDTGESSESTTWWKQRKSGNRQPLIFFSVAMAAAVMGLLVIRHRWQLARAMNHKLLLELFDKEQKINQLMYQLMRTKEMFLRAEGFLLLKLHREVRELSTTINLNFTMRS